MTKRAPKAWIYAPRFAEVPAWLRPEWEIVCEAVKRIDRRKGFRVHGDPIITEHHDALGADEWDGPELVIAFLVHTPNGKIVYAVAPWRGEKDDPAGDDWNCHYYDSGILAAYDAEKLYGALTHDANIDRENYGRHYGVPSEKGLTVKTLVDFVVGISKCVFPPEAKADQKEKRS